MRKKLSETHGRTGLWYDSSTMRVIVFACVVLLVSAYGQSSRTTEQHPPAATEHALTIKVEGPQQDQPHILQYVTALTELTKTLIWPLLFAILVVTQRKPLSKLLDALVELLVHSNRIKLGDMIDLEIDRSAKEAEKRGISGGYVEVPPGEIEAATRVGRIAEAADESAIRARMLEFAHEYEATRSNMKPGPDRTQAMNAIVAKMRTLAIAAAPLLREFALDDSSPGKRLAALAILELAPDLSYVDWIIERMKHEQPFLLFHASLALLAMVRSYGARSRKQLEAALMHSLEIVKSFTEGTPDRNTIDVLNVALSELTGSKT